jgi:hypothetical protein
MLKIKLLLIIFVFPAVLLLSCRYEAQSGKKTESELRSPGDTASIHFRELSHDFGKIAEGEKVAYIFTFENRGTAALVINSASTSCGCTVPKYSTKPIGPGESGSLEVVFDSSGRNGRQTKTVTVSSNATQPVILLTITGEVIMNNNNK